LRLNLDDLQLLPLKRMKLDFNEKLDVEGAVKPVLGELTLAAVGGGVRVSGSVKTLLKLNCHVCLRPYFQALTVDINEQMAFAQPSSSKDDSPRERELTRDDFYEVIPENGVLDIDDIVYQAVTLAAPVFHRCGDECPGPPKPEKAYAAGNSGQTARQGENGGGDATWIDPRWQNLKTLFPKHETGENS
jgi:uncharacterized protein